MLQELHNSLIAHASMSWSIDFFFKSLPTKLKLLWKKMHTPPFFNKCL